MASAAGSRLWEPRRSKSRSPAEPVLRESLYRSAPDDSVSNSSLNTHRRQRQLHKPLPTDDSIRLLYVRKRRRELIRNGRKEHLLDCRIYVRPLPRPGRFYSYNALSYNWGSAENHHAILCNDQFVQVSS